MQANADVPNPLFFPPPTRFSDPELQRALEAAADAEWDIHADLAVNPDKARFRFSVCLVRV